MRRYLRSYDRLSNGPEGEWEVPSEQLVRRLVVAKSDDPDLLDPYPLSNEQVRDFATELNLVFDTTTSDFYLETIENWEKVALARLPHAVG
jgi:hypothetical protein